MNRFKVLSLVGFAALALCAGPARADSDAPDPQDDSKPSVGAVEDDADVASCEETEGTKNVDFDVCIDDFVEDFGGNDLFGEDGVDGSPAFVEPPETTGT
jgi:hypothetical protein